MASFKNSGNTETKSIITTLLMKSKEKLYSYKSNGGVLENWVFFPFESGVLGACRKCSEPSAAVSGLFSFGLKYVCMSC